MSIRGLLCLLYVAIFAFYARRNWFVSLCSAVLLMAVVRHPDMIRNIAGIQGLNPWNVLMLSVLICWLSQRKYQGLFWDMPPLVQKLAILYLLVVTVAFLRLMTKPEGWGDSGIGYVISEYFINCIKWVLPGLVLYDACRTRKRVTIALMVILLVYLLLAIQVIRWMPLSSAVSSDFAGRASKIVQNEVGYNRVTLSMVLGGASWAVLSTLVLVEKRSHKLGIIAAAGVVALGQALTGGRTGYVTWALVGLVLCISRWRRLLPVIPVTVAAVLVFLPGVRERMFQGFAEKGGNVVVENDDYEITSGRTLAWPYVIDKIQESPLIGFGREAMTTTGIYQRILDELPGESFPHPHNAYLEVLLDSGLVGFFCIIPFYIVALRHSFRLLLDRNDPLYCAVGGVACSLILALLFGSMGGQTFYPRESAVGLWAALGVMFRLSVERTRALQIGSSPFASKVAADGRETVVPSSDLRPLPTAL